MAKMHRARAVMNINREKTVSVTGKADAMCTGWENNPGMFPNPSSPSITAIRSQVAVVHKAETLAGTRAKGSASARNVQRSILVHLLEAGVLYVQQIADNSPTLEQAVATIQASALDVALVGSEVKAIIKVRQGPSGSVRLQGHRAELTADIRGAVFFNWQITSDGGKTFTTLPSTPRAKTSVANLTPLTTYGFRVSVTGPDGVPGEWSQIVNFLVH
jgi:hypothetical protein